MFFPFNYIIFFTFELFHYLTQCGLNQDCNNPITNALELLPSYTKKSMHNLNIFSSCRQWFFGQMTSLQIADKVLGISNFNMQLFRKEWARGLHCVWLKMLHAAEVINNGLS